MQDPLSEITERHLFRASTENLNSSEVLEAILVDYMKLLFISGSRIPGVAKRHFMEDLREEIRELIIKKTHATIVVEVRKVSPIELFPTRKLS